MGLLCITILIRFQTFNSLNAKKKAALLTAIFDPVKGINFNLMRHTIGASDLSSVPYSYDNQTAPDPKLKNFNLLDQGRDMAKLLGQMKAISTGMKLLGSVWSPPGLWLDR
jgi:O-glycosyl hydrolase